MIDARHGVPATTLPPELAQRFAMVEAWPATGGQADLFLVEETPEPLRRVVKVYRPGIELDSRVVATLLDASREHVVAHLEIDQLEDRRWYQVLEYVEGGTLRTLMPPGRRWNDASARMILERLVASLEYVHEELRLTHRDVKPSNLLIRSREPLHLVFADFGITRAQGLTMEFGDLRMTPRYAAPEASLGLSGRFLDWWSLGMIIVEGLIGRSPLDGVPDVAIPYTVTRQGVPLDDVPATWLPLARGLLTRDHEHRWGSSEVRAWLDGSDVPVPVDRTAGAPRPMVLEGVELATPGEVADAVAALPSARVDERLAGEIAAWLRYSVGDGDLALRVAGAASALDAEERRFRLVADLDPDRRPGYHGADLSFPMGLASVATAAVEGARIGGREARELVAGPIRRMMSYLGNSSRADGGRYREALQRWQASERDYREALAVAEQMGAPVPTADAGPVAAAQLLAAAVTATSLGGLPKKELAARAASAGIERGRVRRAELVNALATAALRSAVVARHQMLVSEPPWFRQLGDPQLAGAGRLVAMLVLEPAARESTVVTGHGGRDSGFDAAPGRGEEVWSDRTQTQLDAIVRRIAAGRGDAAIRAFERLIDRQAR